MYHELHNKTLNLTNYYDLVENLDFNDYKELKANT